MQYAFYFDQTRCIGCNACTISCKDYNQVNPGPVRWRTQKAYEGDNGVFYNLSMSCNNCEEPACVPSCAASAIYKSDKGMVLIDRRKCQSYQTCIQECPFQAIKIATDQQEPARRENWDVDHPAQKCTYCWERLGDGEKPVCVTACPVYALDFGDFDSLQREHSDAVRMNREDFPYAYREGGTVETKPRFLVKKRRPLKIHEYNG